jgi:Family of unknown function (DUF5670)
LFAFFPGLSEKVCQWRLFPVFASQGQLQSRPPVKSVEKSPQKLWILPPILDAFACVYRQEMPFHAWHEFDARVRNKTKIMSNLLYVVAVIFVIAWALGFFVYSLGSVVHILLVIAVIAILFRLIRGERI